MDPVTGITITSFTVPISLLERAREHVAVWVKAMTERCQRRGLEVMSEVVSLASVML